MKDLLSQLNQEQRSAVTYNDGPQLVIAGAGSGKTRVLTYKIAYLVQQGMKPWSILALTFTNKAANEMKQRIAQLIGQETARYIQMGTFHSIFSRILRIEADAIGYRMKLVTYTTTSANMMLREIGLVLFLASVGIKAGDGFVNTVIQGDGLKYVYTGILITVIPILIVGTIARLKFKFNYFTIMGMIAGTYTDPPALAYANQVCSHDAPSTGYSTVYPLSMFLRIFTAQLIVLFCCG